MRFSLILAGLIFLFSPDISLLDFLPDVIGWLLIFWGLCPLADIEIRAEDAKSLSKRMIFLSFAKLILSLFTFRFNSPDLLLVVFSYALLEIITVFPLVKNLFSALDYTAMRVSAPLNSDKINIAKWYLWVFFAVKNALTVLPATVSLFDSRYTGEYSENTWSINFDSLLRLLFVFCFFISAVMAIVMLVEFIPFWSKIIKNRDLREKMLSHRRDTVLKVPSRMIVKNTGTALSFFIPAIPFFFDFYIDGVDVLPTFIGFVAVFVGALWTKKRLNEPCTALVITSLIGSAVSFVQFLYRVIPLAKNSFIIDYNFSNKPLTLPLSAISSALVITVFILLYRLASNLNHTYTKYKLEDSVTLYMIGGAVIAGFDFLLYSFPDKNTTFVFPSLIFGIAFSAISANYLIKLKKQIKHDNKD